MRTIIIGASALAMIAFAAPAYAQDDEKSFSGPRAEAIVGWDRVSDDSIYDATKDGVVFGGAIGYDVRRGNAVFGVEGEVTGATTKQVETGVLIANDSLRVKAGRDLYVGGRVGYVVGNRALVYAKAGYSNARISETYVAPGTPGINISDHDDLNGWRIGAGAEVSLTGNLYLKGEYRYSDYDGSSLGLDPKRHQVVGGIGIRF